MTRFENAQFFFLEHGQFTEIPHEDAMHLTARQLVNNPTVLKIETAEKFEYFAGNEEAYLKIEEKTPRRIAEIFESGRKALVERGLLSGTSIDDWSLQDLLNHEEVFEIFPGAKEVRRRGQYFQTKAPVATPVVKAKPPYPINLDDLSPKKKEYAEKMALARKAHLDRTIKAFEEDKET